MRLEDRPEPAPDSGTLLVQALALGVCGTDREIVAGAYGWAPPGGKRLILGHESLGRVLDAPPGCALSAGELVVGIVRRRDPIPCVACAAGEWDMCRNGLYTERGIKGHDGYGAERFRLEPEYAVKIDPALELCGVLLEPATIVAKAWDHIDRIGHRTRSWSPRTVLVTGAGPVGLLAALMARQRGHEIHVLDRAETGPKPELVRELGGTYHAHDLPDSLRPDIALECTGAVPLIVDVLKRAAIDGIVCLTGVSGSRPPLPFDFGQFNRDVVLGNIVVFGTVNANRTHYEMGATALAQANRTWLAKMIRRRVPLARWQEAFENRPDDIKVILQFSEEAT
ncbi:glucose 1-dehydrogenase [Reyranella sp.]|uniref:glucose 1-dehydrogenase n=1 Tax=Reyranella sp. TaxID=1929291 RepID=UPI003D0BBDE7